MGLKLPRFVHGFVDRHGKPRCYFRRPGFESKPLRGVPYSAASWAITKQP
jgi:hypothetical protein